MKHLFTLALIALFGLSTQGFAAGNNFPYPTAVANLSQIELNLLNGINSENEGLQSSSAFYLGEMKSSKAVIPLLKTLHEGESEAVRIMAALSLIKIGDARGVYAVKRASEFDGSERVRNLCKGFYAAYTAGKVNL